MNHADEEPTRGRSIDRSTSPVESENYNTHNRTSNEEQSKPPRATDNSPKQMEMSKSRPMLILHQCGHPSRRGQRHLLVSSSDQTSDDMDIETRLEEIVGSGARFSPELLESIEKFLTSDRHTSAFPQKLGSIGKFLMKRSRRSRRGGDVESRGKAPSKGPTRSVFNSKDHAAASHQKGGEPTSHDSNSTGSSQRQYIADIVLPRVQAVILRHLSTFSPQDSGNKSYSTTESKALKSDIWILPYCCSHDCCS
jgi:hypothetical protein